MKNTKIIIWAMILWISLFVGLSKVFAVLLNDGGIHNIDYEINDYLSINDSLNGMPTHINLLTGSIIRKQCSISGNSELYMYDGILESGVLTYNSAQLEIYDGVIRRGGYYFGYGGIRAGFSLLVGTNTIVEIFDGSIKADIVARNNNITNIYGGILYGNIDVGTGGSVIIHGRNFIFNNNPVNYTIFGIGSGTIGHLTGELLNNDIINCFLRINAGSITLISEPPVPPIANAGGPYSVYIGDALILDANNSTDPDNDIVSYMWDLDDDGIFETDADNQQICDVNYSYLESLSLLINYEYTIHLKVIDSEGQSDIDDSTLIIIPKPAVRVAVDIKPGSCPNPINTKSSGVLPVAILGSNDYDITAIDSTSIRLAGVEPLRSNYEDVATPIIDNNDCNCIETGPDGLLDLTLKFETQAIIKAVGDVNDGDIMILELTGVLYDPIPFETPIAGTDCILIKNKHRNPNKADINKDGVVNGLDFAIISGNWLACTHPDCD